MPLNAERIESSLAVGAKDVGVRSLDIGVLLLACQSPRMQLWPRPRDPFSQMPLMTWLREPLRLGASEVIVKDDAASVVRTRNKSQGNASGVAEMPSSNLNFKSVDVDTQVFGVAHHPVAKEATFEIAGAGVVCTHNKTQGNAGGAAKIVSGNINCKDSVVHALGFGVTQSASSDPGVFVKGLCTNVTDRQFIPSDIAVKSVFVSHRKSKAKLLNRTVTTIYGMSGQRQWKSNSPSILQ